MNENAAAHLLFGPITSLQSLQRFQWHPNPAAARKRVGGKHSLLALLEQKKYAVAPNDGFRSKRRSRDVDVFVTRIPAQPPPSFICPPPPVGATRGPDDNPAFAAGPKRPITEKEVR